ncbi:MAG: prolyl oligopeptidase family serine peptidase [Acidobacteria bacterium]|nr:prolyl oligopeptidase family serine peptidase [Acidobacteriota bacterium]
MKPVSIRLFIFTFVFVVLISLSGFAQDAAQVLRMSVGYRTMKNQTPMSDETRKAVEELEVKARAANTDKKYGEAIKHMTHGMALMQKRPWTPIAVLTEGTVAKLERCIFDPGDTVKVTLAQIFSLDDSVDGKLKGALSIAVTKDGKQQTLKELKQLADVEADFRKPLTLEATIPDLPDGNYEIVVKLSPRNEELFYKSNSIRIARDVNVQAGLLKTRAAMFRKDLESRYSLLNKEPMTTLAVAEYKAALIDLVNSGQMSVVRTDLKTEIAEANELLDQITKGENPLRAKRGDIHWAYQSAVDNSFQPYRFYVPTNYDAKKKWPLVVALHGMGGDENSFFASYNNGEIKRIAEARGYLVVCPKGRGPASMYMGSAETDVIDVLNAMKRDYSIDDDRVYLMGHSMGGYGSWSVAVNNPDLFAAIAPISGGGQPLVMMNLKKIAHVPWIVIHGDKDPTVSVEESRKMVKAGKELGIEIKYIEVPGGNHTSIAVPAFKDIFDWFDAHKRQPAGAKAAAKAAGIGR